MGPRELPPRHLAGHGTVKPFGAVLGAAVLTGLGATAVVAHVELISSSPAAGANLSSPPGEVTITFDDELDPGRAPSPSPAPARSRWERRGGPDGRGSQRDGSHGHDHRARHLTVTYTAVGVDGHAVAGIFRFGYLATATIPVRPATRVPTPLLPCQPQPSPSAPSASRPGPRPPSSFSVASWRLADNGTPGGNNPRARIAHGHRGRLRRAGRPPRRL